MSLKAIRVQDWSAEFAYAPPLRDAVINLDEVVDAVPCESRGSGPWMKVKFRDGSSHIAQGRPSDLLPGAEGLER